MSPPSDGTLLPPPLPTLAGRSPERRVKFGWSSPCQTSPCGAQSPHAALSASQSPQSLRGSRASQSPQSLRGSRASQSPQLHRGSHALPNVELRPSIASSAPAPADSSAGLTQETVAIASAIAAALATLDGIGPSAQQDDRISKALRYIAENPSIALSSPPAPQ